MSNENDTGVRSDRRLALMWATEAGFVASIMVAGLIAFLVLTSGSSPFATALIPIVLAIAVVLVVTRQRWFRRHRGDDGISFARHAARERRGF